MGKRREGVAEGARDSATPAGSQRWFAIDGLRMCDALASLLDAGVMRHYTGGVVAALLNHRLHAVKPPAWGLGIPDTPKGVPA